MSNESVISVTGLSKRYHLYERPADRLKKALWGGGEHREFLALNDVSFTLKKGESMGIIGRNGSGKSTLLQIIAGTLKPTRGEVSVNGRVSAMLELGSGFNPDFTGRENVFLNGAILGLSRREMESKFDDIAAFADIGKFIDQPVKEYSSGMIMRLAFAVQVMVEPDILIVDEVLSVGDFFFQQKCLGHIRSLCEKGVTLLFVSHDMGMVRDICQRAIYLKEGQVQFIGESRLAARQYLAEMSGSAKVSEDTSPASTESEAFEAAEENELERIVKDCVWAATPEAPGGGAGRLIAVALYDAEGNPNTSFRLGGTMRIKVAYRPAVEKPTHVSMTIRNRYDQVATVLGSVMLGLTPPGVEQGQTAIFEMRATLMLEAGDYSAMVSLSSSRAPNHGKNLDSSAAIGPISVQWDYEKDQAPFLGMLGLPVEGEFKTVGAGDKP